MSCTPHRKRTLAAMPATWTTAENVAQLAGLRRQAVAQDLSVLRAEGYVTSMKTAKMRPTLWIITDQGIAHRKADAENAPHSHTASSQRLEAPVGVR